MELYIVLTGWVIYYIVWLILARQVNLTKLSNPLPFREGFVWFISWFLVFILLLVDKIIDWHTNYLYVIGFYLSFYFALLTRFQLGEDWKPFAAKESSFRIMTKGMYRYLRHPLYFWQFFMTLFTAINLQKFFPAIVFVVLPSIANRLRAQSERDMLLRKYPLEYSFYRGKTFWGIIFRTMRRLNFP